MVNLFRLPTRLRSARSVMFMLVGLVLIATLSACGSGGEPSAAPAATEPAGSTAAAATTSPEASKEVPAKLAFTATTVDGASFDGADLAGRPTAVWFWAPWCSTCRSVAPEIATVAKEYADAVNVVGVAGLSEDLPAMRSFVSATGIEGFPSLVDTDGALYRRFSVAAQDTWAFVDDSGKVSTETGLSESQLRSRLDALVG